MPDNEKPSHHDLLRNMDLLLARQEAIEYLAVEFFAARFAELSEADIVADCERLRGKLRSWPPIWERELMVVDEFERRREMLDKAVGALLQRAGDRAFALAVERSSARLRRGEGGKGPS